MLPLTLSTVDSCLGRIFQVEPACALGDWFLHDHSEEACVVSIRLHSAGCLVIYCTILSLKMCLLNSMSQIGDCGLFTALVSPGFLLHTAPK